MAKLRSTAEVTRFAPSPTGHLHLGHAYSALKAYRARGPGGSFLLRIEDIDPGRCRDEFVESIREDLRWLGLGWEEPVRRQSEHMDDYRRATAALERRDLVYPCFCTRSDIRLEIERSGQAPHGPEGPIYPGLCRGLPAAERAAALAAGRPCAMRLDVVRAAAAAGPLAWRDLERGDVAARPERFGDVVLARKDVPTSYHLSVVVDDHLQGVTLVTRGADLAPLTDVHRLLQALLGYEPPEYRHHRLIAGPDGRRFAKRDRAMTIRSLRMSGHSPSDVVAMTGIES